MRVQTAKCRDCGPLCNACVGRHWTERWLGWRGGDCAEFVRLVLEREFGRRVDPPPASGQLALERRIAAARGTLAAPTARPTDGDAALMRRPGRRWGHHVGLCAVVGGRPHVLHVLRGQGAALHDEDALRRVGLEIEGWYRWL